MPDKERILVHTCCASCSSYVLEYLQDSYEVAAFFYNPNIQPEGEYLLRLDEMRRVCRSLGVELFEGEYDTEAWQEKVAPLSHLPEKSERCWTCYRIRLEETAAVASGMGIKLITTTLSVSPHKIHPRIVEEGERAAAGHGLRFLGEDFKKKDGFRISVERSGELGLTRQDYCGCLFSLEEAEKRKGYSG